MKLRACQDGDPTGSPFWQCGLALAPTCSDVKPGAASFGDARYIPSASLVRRVCIGDRVIFLGFALLAVNDETDSTRSALGLDL